MMTCLKTPAFNFPLDLSHVLSKPLQFSSLNCCTFLELSVNPISDENINTSLYRYTDTRPLTITTPVIDTRPLTITAPVIGTRPLSITTTVNDTRPLTITTPVIGTRPFTTPVTDSKIQSQTSLPDKDFWSIGKGFIVLHFNIHFLYQK